MQTPLLSRLAGLGIACAANIFLLLVLLGFRAGVFPPPGSAPLSVINLRVVQPKPPVEPEPKRRPELREVRPVPRVVAPTPIVRPPMLADPLPAAPEAPAPPAPAKTAPVVAAAPAATTGTAGPLAAPVLAAREWVRKPSTSQLDRYRPVGSPAGWGVVSCRTAPGRRVTDCVEVTSFPESSRLATAVRRAAWQFRIMPPRRNGEDLMGEWIQIRVDYVAPKR